MKSMVYEIQITDVKMYYKSFCSVLFTIIHTGLMFFLFYNILLCDSRKISFFMFVC